jgi:CrcB protein
LCSSAVGAPLRYLADRVVQARHDSVFPWGTWCVNVVGSLLLGFLVTGLAEGGVSSGVLTLLGTGFCGALTTYSTFGYETFRLFEDGSKAYALINVVGSIVAGVVAAVLGAVPALAERDRVARRARAVPARSPPGRAPER